MALLKLEDFNPDYRESFDGNDIKGMGVYTDTDEKIGTVNDALVDEEGNFRYFIVDLGFWIFGKKVLMPVGRSRVDYDTDRVVAVGMTRAQADNLPEFNEGMALDYDYEEQVRGVYRSPAGGASVSSTERVAPLDASNLPLNAASTSAMSAMAQQGYDSTDEASAPEGATYGSIATPEDINYDRAAYTYQQEPSLYQINEQDNKTLKLYEERLIANKKRVKTGEVAVSKHIETETATVSVPIERERVVIERVTPANAGTAVPVGEASFSEVQTTRVEIYEETPDIQKEAFVREEIKVTKVVDQETVEAQEILRREELDVNTDGNPIVDTSKRSPNNRI